MLGSPAGAGSASAATKCKTTQIAVKYLGAHHKPAPLLCLKQPRLGHTRIQAGLAIERLLSSGRLLPKRLRHVLPPFPRALERAFARTREKQLRGLASRAATTTQSSGKIAPGPGQVGQGTFSEASTTSQGDDAEHATVGYTHSFSSRHTAFGPTCADFNGKVVTKLDWDDKVTKATERHGKRTVVEIEYRITGTFTGAFTDAFAPTAPLHVDLDFVVERRSHTEIAVTHKVLTRSGTETQRVAMTHDIPYEKLGAISDPVKAFTDMTITGASGPKGRLTEDDFLANHGSLFALLVGTIGTAELDGASAFAETVEGMNDFKCVTAVADPASLTLPRGEQGSFTVTVSGLDDQRPLPSEQASRVFTGSLTLTPLSDTIAGPATGTVYQVTNDGGKGSVAISPRSRRGRAPTVNVPINEPPPDDLYFTVSAYTFNHQVDKSGTFHGSTTVAETYGPEGAKISPAPCDGEGADRVCFGGIKVGATRTQDGTVGRDTPPCSFTYDTDTRPHLAQAAFLQISPGHPEQGATLTFAADGLEIGDVTSDACGGHTSGKAQPNTIDKVVSTPELLSGRSVTVTWDLAGTVPADPPEHTGDPLAYHDSGSVTLHRVLVDGSPYPGTR